MTRMKVYRLIYRGPVKTVIDKSGAKPFLERNYWKIMNLIDDSIQVSISDITYTVTTEGWKEKAQISTQGGEKPVIKRFLSDLQQDDVVWDIGANIGLYSIPANSIAEEVIAFEPVPYNAARLRSHAPEIDIREIAISNKSGQINVESGDDISLGWSTEKGSKGQVSRDIVVPTEINARQPTVVKIDIEGGEWDVLHGMENWLSNGDIRLVYIEVHPHHLPTKANINAYLEKFGYSCEKFYQRGENHFVIAKIDT